MKSLILFLFAISLSMVASADQAPQKLNGYGKTFWGMTPAEVMTAETPRAKPLPDQPKYDKGVGLVNIRSLSIGGSNFDVIFVFDSSSNGLSQVILRGLEEKNVLLNIDTFTRLEKMLTEKYGPSTFRDSGAPKNKGKNEISWSSGNTRVELNHLFIPGIVTSVSVSYEPISSANQESKDL